MIISCPNCTMRYDIQPALLGNGRSTRCFNCGHMWFQDPVVSPPSPMPPSPAVAPAMAQAMTPALAPDMADAQSGMATQPPPGQVTPAQPVAYQQPAAPVAAPAPVFEPIPEPVPVESLIPDDDGEEQQPRSIIKLMAIGGVLFIAIILGAAFFAKGLVMDMLPFTKGIYESIGRGEKLGAGLKFGDATPRRGVSRGKEALIITGVITNVSDEPRHVPMIKAALRDGENQEVQSAMAAPLKSELPPGERMKFKVILIEPSPLARRVEVVFSAGPDTAGEKAQKNH